LIFKHQSVSLRHKPWPFMGHIIMGQSVAVFDVADCSRLLS